MKDKKNKPVTEDDRIDQELEGNSQSQTEDTHTDEMEDAEVEASLEADLLKMREAVLRTAAEYGNYRKRVAKEKEDIIRYANERLLEDLLPILDNFDMGMQAAKNDESSMIYIGMSMVKKQLDDFLGNQGITPINTDGLFDHNIHEAFNAEITDKTTPEGTILRIMRRGFLIKGKLLRPALVVVSRHPSEEDELDA